MFYEALVHLGALDLGWFINLVIGNLFWLFAFYAIMFYFMGGKRTLYFTILFALIMWAFSDLEVLAGLFWTSAAFLLLYYVTKLAVVAFIESTPKLNKYLVIIATLQFYILFLIFNFLMR